MLLVGFVDTSNRVFTQNLRPGESFVFPKGLVHFLFNSDSREPAIAISGLNSQNPGAQIASLATFASKPPIPDDILKKAFQISKGEVETIRRNLGGWLIWLCCSWRWSNYGYHFTNVLNFLLHFVWDPRWEHGVRLAYLKCQIVYLKMKRKRHTNHHATLQCLIIKLKSNGWSESCIEYYCGVKYACPFFFSSLIGLISFPIFNLLTQFK